MFQKKYRCGHVEIYFNTHKIFSFNKDGNFLARLLSSGRNAAWNERNGAVIRSRPGVERHAKRVLFVIRSLESAGGVETRLARFASALRAGAFCPVF